MTYMLNGKQFIVAAIAGPGFPGELIAFKLPDGSEGIQGRLDAQIAALKRVGARGDLAVPNG